MISYEAGLTCFMNLIYVTSFAIHTHTPGVRFIHTSIFHLNSSYHRYNRLSTTQTTLNRRTLSLSLSTPHIVHFLTPSYPPPFGGGFIV